MGPKEQNNENPTVVKPVKKIIRVDRDQVRAHKKESARFVVLLTRGDLAMLRAKRVTTARSEIILRTFAERHCGILVGENGTRSR